MCIRDRHPALRASVPQSPMVDGWMGDDWFHNGAFRQPNFDYITSMTTDKGDNDAVSYTHLDVYKRQEITKRDALQNPHKS